MRHEQALALAEAWLRRVTCARLNYGDCRRGALRTEDLMPMTAKLSLKTSRLESIAGTADYVRPQTGNPEGFALLLDARAPRISMPPRPVFWTKLASSSEERV